MSVNCKIPLDSTEHGIRLRFWHLISLTLGNLEALKTIELAGLAGDSDHSRRCVNLVIADKRLKFFQITEKIDLRLYPLYSDPLMLKTSRQ